MSSWTLTVLLGIAWLSYPLAGAANVSADVMEGKRPKGAGFIFLTELLVFPAVFVGVAALLDHFIMPWGRRLVGCVCIVMFGAHVYVYIHARRRMRAAEAATLLKPGASE